MPSDKILTRLSSGKDHLDSEISTGTITVDPKLKKPPLYRVILLNDDYTPMEFVVMVLESDNAVLKNRELMGATDPTKAEEGTLRKKFGLSIDKNSVHGSDSLENAKIEIDFFFKD